ncbi:homoserine kinase [Jeotgalibacillus haloalkalitolerans]|uniref:Homoserine kinase n=1 Tax=Jeotgalibacillus haloalkalitolerans TaxID=3104292 RepID=A0ABU5KLN2_9BACL|nr:homoserine kinase [Jeotgalibacillus sp. HH7-29]MDZ5711866.1 homoserine kinase [Jeotgalibacillus sp. HH7-29]
MSFSPFTVKTPASTANLGPGFDSIGLALPIFQTIEVEPSSRWNVSYKQDEFQHLPVDDTNLILKTIQEVAAFAEKACPAATLTVSSDIPLSKGLGSSAAAIAAGIVIADRLMGLEMSLDEQIKTASDIEGHPDNVSASLAGGLTVSRYEDDELVSVSLPAEGFSVIIMAPEAELETKESRGVLPQSLTHRDAVLASAAANVMVASLITGNFKKAGSVMMKDTFHEPYRKPFFPQLEDIKDFACKSGAFAVTISGAGPCISIFAEDARVSPITEHLKGRYDGYQTIQLKPVNQGTLLIEQHLNRLSV